MRNILFAVIGIVTLSLFSCQKSIQTADYQVVPLPKEINISDEKPFVLDKNTVVTYSESQAGLQKEADFLADYFEDILGFRLNALCTDEEIDNSIRLEITTKFENSESYQIIVTEHFIKLSANTSAGIFYGIQTLRKSLPVGGKASKIAFPAGIINDWPRFAYRGMHLDVSRHFFPIDSVKVYLDAMALHNLNRFHIHISDD
ncbi:MAG: beta-N-acetylhexosaminidase, partial [Paludibacteraceae bacterium]|nr:beta-N-acetylhexosaminidase [Paludibacteraceae bacterium]